MNDSEHVFPLPEPELHKLDEVKEGIAHPMARRTRRFLRSNAWTVMAISMAAGLMWGLAWGRRRVFF